MAENVGRRGGSWYYRLDLPAGPDGRRRQKRVSGFPTEREARKALAKAAVDVQEGRLRCSPRRTVAEVVEEWLEVVGPNRKATTAANYRMLCQAYIVPRIGSKRLERLAAPDVQTLYADLREGRGRGGRPLLGTQVRNIHRVLHNLLSYGRRMGYLAVNPADMVDKPSGGHSRAQCRSARLRSFTYLPSARLRRTAHTPSPTRRPNIPPTTVTGIPNSAIAKIAVGGWTLSPMMRPTTAPATPQSAIPMPAARPRMECASTD